MVIRDVQTWLDDFLGARSFSTTPEGYTGWTIADTSSAGTPTYASVTPSETGEVKLLHDNTNEVQNVCLYHQDKLSFDIDRIQQVRMIAKVADIAASTSLVFGIGSARNDTLDSVATNLWFRMEGGTSTSLVVVESDDGTTDNDDKATGITLSTTYKEFIIDFSEGKTDVRFYIDGNHVASGTTFSVNAATGSVQPIIQIQKSAATATASITLDLFEIRYKRAAGA